MKKKIKNILLFFLFAFTTISCKKSFLEIQPKGKLIATSVSDYGLLLNNLDLVNLGGVNAQVFMGDEVAAVNPHFMAAERRDQRLFKWDASIYENDEDAPEISSLMGNVYTYNKIINEVSKATGGTEALKKSIHAEALAGRAWTYFLLINYFGAPYTESSSETDPGFPIITEADVTATEFTRSSVKEVYDFILKDLNDAIVALPDKTTSRIRMSAAAAYGLLGKVYLFMGKYDLALSALESSFQKISNSDIPIELYDYNSVFAPGGEFLPISFFGPTTPSTINDKEVLYAKTFSNFWITSSEIVINSETKDLFSLTDQRLNFYSETPFPFGDPYPMDMLRRAGPLTSQFGVTLPDLYLLRAECYARSNDLSKAVKDVEELRKSRMSEAEAEIPSGIASDKMSLLNFILEERIREFASTGYRWFDMRRLSVDPLFDQQNYLHKLYDPEGNTTPFSLANERFVLKIPPKILLENPGMNDNP